MSVHHVVDALHGAGLSLALTPEQALKVTPASKLTTELRDLIRASKSELIDLLARMKAANDDATPWRVTVAPGTPPDALARMRAASLALDKVQAATPPDTPDASCWPHSTAMNGAELDTFTARLARFTDRGPVNTSPGLKWMPKPWPTSWCSGIVKATTGGFVWNACTYNVGAAATVRLLASPYVRMMRSCHLI